VATIRVDPQRIEDLAGELRSLRSEFDSLERRVDDYQSAVGHGRVVGQLEELASNWSDARDDILQRLEHLAAACDGVARTYRDQEAHLAKQAQSVSGGS
jgi:hypothetical protein